MSGKKKRPRDKATKAGAPAPRNRPVTAGPLPGARPPQPASASSPAGLAAIMGIVVGLALTGHGASIALSSGLERVSYWLGVVLIGPLLVACSWLMMRGLRTGWAFFVGITGPAALATFFGAPTIRKAIATGMSEGDSLGLQWTLALVPMLLFAAMCVLASVDHARFEDSD